MQSGQGIFAWNNLRRIARWEVCDVFCIENTKSEKVLRLQLCSDKACLCKSLYSLLKANYMSMKHADLCICFPRPCFSGVSNRWQWTECYANAGPLSSAHRTQRPSGQTRGNQWAFDRAATPMSHQPPRLPCPLWPASSCHAVHNSALNQLIFPLRYTLSLSSPPTPSSCLSFVLFTHVFSCFSACVSLLR